MGGGGGGGKEGGTMYYTKIYSHENHSDILQNIQLNIN